MYLKRDIQDLMFEMGNNFAGLWIQGPRMCGKSSMALNAFENLELVTLEDEMTKRFANLDPKAFLDAHGTPLLIGEIQKAPKLLNYIKIKIDEKKREWLFNCQPLKLLYIVTCSNDYELWKKVSVSLAGRIGIIDMFSLSENEKMGVKGLPFSSLVDELRQREATASKPFLSRNETYESIFAGSMPEVISRSLDRSSYYRSYVNTYLQKDVKPLLADDPQGYFLTFMEMLALRSGQALNVDDLSRNIGVESKTIRRWLAILEGSGLIILLRPYMANSSNRLVKSPKVYFTDCGLCTYLCRWQDAEMLRKGNMSGAIFETYVVFEIVKKLVNFGKDYRNCLYYYRDFDQKEIDLLYLENDIIYPIEIKKGLSPDRPDKNFSVLSRFGKEVASGLVVANYDRLRPISEHAFACPVGLLQL